MIDLKDLRENPDRYRTAPPSKQMAVDIDRCSNSTPSAARP
jgi:hypothetical protein